MTEKGLLAVWMDVEPSGAADFAEWYIREHIPERVGVPGFRNGNRYRVLDGTPGFLAVYDTESPKVLSSAPYQERLDNPTPWTQRVMPMFRNTVRSTCTIVQEAGIGMGGVLRTYRIEPKPDGREVLRAALAALPISEWIDRPGVVRVRVAESAASGPAQETAETEMRGPDTVASFVVLVDITDASVLQKKASKGLPEPDWTALGAVTPVETGDYALMYNLVDGG